MKSETKPLQLQFTLISVILLIFFIYAEISIKDNSIR